MDENKGVLNTVQKKQKKQIKQIDMKTITNQKNIYIGVQSNITNKLTNLLMKNGKKSKAQKIIIKLAHLFAEQNKTLDIVHILEKSIEDIKPIFEIRNKKLGGNIFKIPVAVTPERQNTLAIKWLLETAKLRSEKTLALKIYNELLSVQKKQSSLLKKKEELHKLANTNRAFMHYAW